MIDRTARNEVVAAFEEYLDGQIMAFRFDERIQSIVTDDPTVNEVVRSAWYHYDDVKDHKVRLSKAEWDYFQRLLLLLRSDAEISTSQTKRWAWDHGLAWVAVITFAGLAFSFGWSLELLVSTLPFGLISILINQYRVSRTSNALPRHIACTPFASYSQIRWLRRQLPNFVKRPYRKDLHGRPIRSRVEELFNPIVAFPAWLILSPIALFFQGFPTVESEFITLTKP